MTKTVVIQIGNSDNKLSQEEWAQFCSELKSYLDSEHMNFQFCASSVGWEPWQNLALIFVCQDNEIPELRKNVTQIREKYRQDSAAWLEGVTKFI